MRHETILSVVRHESHNWLVMRHETILSVVRHESHSSLVMTQNGIEFCDKYEEISVNRFIILAKTWPTGKYFTVFY